MISAGLVTPLPHPSSRESRSARSVGGARSASGALLDLGQLSRPGSTGGSSTGGLFDPIRAFSNIVRSPPRCSARPKRRSLPLARLTRRGWLQALPLTPILGRSREGSGTATPTGLSRAFAPKGAAVGIDALTRACTLLEGCSAACVQVRLSLHRAELKRMQRHLLRARGESCVVSLRGWALRGGCGSSCCPRSSRACGGAE